MKKNAPKLFFSALALLMQIEVKSQITQLQDYQHNNAPIIGTFQGITFKEAGFSGLYPIAGTDGKEFWTVSDRGTNIDAANANPSGCHPTYDKIYAFPSYAPKIHRVRLQGDTIKLIQTITIKRPNGSDATGIINPTGLGSTATEVASTDTVLDCVNFNLKIAAKDTFGIDSEGILVDKDGNFWLCEEGGPTVWKLNKNGKVVARYTPYANLPGIQSVDVAIDTVFKYRKNNRGFEGIAITPNGKIYAIIQSPILYPTKSVGENTRIHRILEIDPVNHTTKMYAYLNDSIIGSGGNQIRLRDWKIGDMAAVNDSMFVVMEAAARGTTDIKRIYLININQATPVHSGLYSGQTLEQLIGYAGLNTNGIKPVTKTLVMDLLANNWPSVLDKAEGLAIINDSTIAIANDNDYGQYSPAEDGVATATGKLSHIITYRLSGNNKLPNYNASMPLLSQGITGPSSTQSPYLMPTVSGGEFTSIITTGDIVGTYTTCGTPDGIGAIDNGDSTFTIVMNHEFGNTVGITRAHGSKGSFVSKWLVKKSDLSVMSGSDLIQNVNLWNGSGYTTYNAGNPSLLAAFNRFCSADLPASTAFYNRISGLGTMERIFMNGEESGTEGRAFGHIVTGTNAGTSYELPYLGKLSWENSVARPYESDTTVVIGLDDATPGQVYVYIGVKTNTGTEIEKAGLSNGILYGVAVNGMITETNGSIPTPGTIFTLKNLGVVRDSTGAAINNASNNSGVTNFLRPEDGAWDPSNPNDFYFATTNSFSSPSRLWKLHFTNPATPSLGGTITAVLDGTEGQKMMDNIAIDYSGHILIVEDVGNNAHIGKLWQYDINTDALVQVGQHDSTRFISGSANYLTQDEESSGILDVQNILGDGMFLTDVQAHYPIPGQLVEGGQLLSLYNPATANSNPEINITGNSVNISNNDLNPSISDYTAYGNVKVNTSKDHVFVIQNNGSGDLSITAVSFSGLNANEFSIVGSATPYPWIIPSSTSYSLTLRFSPQAIGTRTATVHITNNNYSKTLYNFALAGTSVEPEINIKGNGNTITNGDVTPSTTDNTDFSNVAIGTFFTRLFNIQNTGSDTLTLTGITFTGTNAGEFTIIGGPSFPFNINPASSAIITVRFAPLGSGNRTAEINIASNDADESIYNFSLKGNAYSTAGIEDAANTGPAVEVFPNPTKDETNVSVILNQEEIISINVMDAQGKVVITIPSINGRTGENKVVLNTSSLSRGTYFVQINTLSGTSTIKTLSKN